MKNAKFLPRCPKSATGWGRSSRRFTTRSRHPERQADAFLYGAITTTPTAFTGFTFVEVDTSSSRLVGFRSLPGQTALLWGVGLFGLLNPKALPGGFRP
jgi:hypothetical protein